MIIELLLSPIFLLISACIGLLPTLVALPNWLIYFIEYVRKGLSFFPSTVFIIIMSNVVFWLSLHMIWAIIEWLYKKVPGVD